MAKNPHAPVRKHAYDPITAAEHRENIVHFKTPAERGSGDRWIEGAALRRILAHLDFETSNRAGAGGMFQVASLEDGDGNDLTNLIDAGRHFHALEELEEALSIVLGEFVSIEEV